MRTAAAHVGMKVRQEHRILARLGMVGLFSSSWSIR